MYATGLWQYLDVFLKNSQAIKRKVKQKKIRGELKTWHKVYICLIGILIYHFCSQPDRQTGLPLIIHLKIPLLFPDILQFSIPSDRSKRNHLYSLLIFFILVLTVSLQILGSKFFPLRVATNEEGDRLRLSHKQVFPLLNRINKFPEDCLPQPFIFKLPDFFLTFQVLSKFSWPAIKFPDFSLTWKKFLFPDIFPWPWQPWTENKSWLPNLCHKQMVLTENSTDLGRK